MYQKNNYFNRHTKPKKANEESAVLASRFNKNMVRQQLLGLFDYDLTNAKDKERLGFDTEDVRAHWESLHADHLKRPRYINLSDCLSNAPPLLILVSGWSDMFKDDYKYKMIFISYANHTSYFAIPVGEVVVKLLGGECMVSRWIAKGGMEGLIDVMSGLLEEADSIDHKDRIKANITLLKELTKGI